MLVPNSRIFEFYDIWFLFAVPAEGLLDHERRKDGVWNLMMFANSTDGYREWRAAKLDNYPKSATELVTEIDGLLDMSDSQKEAILASCRRANMAIYSCRDAFVDRKTVRNFAGFFGLTRIDHHLCANDDGVSELAVAADGVRSDYVPYSSRSLSWHTDGYYNDVSRRLQAVLLHCSADAANGGQNAVLDPEIAYLRLRDANPDYIAAFEHPECMEIPANNGADGEIRPAVSGPVFWYDLPSGALRMRYSARKKNIRWRNDAATTAARECLSDLLGDDDGLVLRFRLKPGQGLISNNVLHNRTAFEDTSEQKRLLYRARFFDSILRR
jgi:alpha-ketoglutarate-dependent taurine dioxygenase